MSDPDPRLCRHGMACENLLCDAHHAPPTPDPRSAVVEIAGIPVNRAALGAVAIECEHGWDVCPSCDAPPPTPDPRSAGLTAALHHVCGGSLRAFRWMRDGRALCGSCGFAVRPVEPVALSSDETPRTGASRSLLDDWCSKERWGYLFPDVQRELITAVRAIEAEAERYWRRRLGDEWGQRVLAAEAARPAPSALAEFVRVHQASGHNLSAMCHDCAAQPPAPGEPVALRCPDCQHPWSLHGPTGGCRSHTSTCGCAPPDGCMCAYNAPEPPLAAADFRMEGVSSAEWGAFEAAITDKPPLAAAALDELLPTAEALLRYVEDRADPADDDFTDVHRAVVRRAAKTPLAAAGLGVDYEAMRMQRGWPTPNHMRRAADALDALTPARYGDVLRWFADLADAALAAHPEPGP